MEPPAPPATGPSMASPQTSDLPNLTPSHSGSVQSTDQTAAITQNLSNVTLNRQDQLRQNLNQRKENKQANLERWAKSGKQITGFPSNLEQNGDTSITANFHEVTVLEPHVELRRYHVVFGDLKGRKVTKSDLKRTLVKEMLLAHPPSATHYAADYFLHFVSQGKLYNDFNDDLHAVGTTIDKTFLRPLRPGAPTGTPRDTMPISIVYDGPVRISDLIRFVNQDVDIDPTYSPDEDLKALNIVSWGLIYRSDDFGRVGTKFYPTSSQFVSKYPPVEVCRRLKSDDGSNPASGGVLWVIKTGFFSSMRPGDKQLLLNVTATATAFFSKITLEQWIYNYMGSGRYSRDEFLRNWKKAGLKGLKVKFKFAPDPQKIWTICEIIAETVSEKKFTPKVLPKEKTKPAISVRDYINTKFGQQAGRDGFCVNVGIAESGKEIWYPAEYLDIMDWQVVSSKDADLTRVMVNRAKRTPDLTQRVMKDGALEPLQITPPSQQYYANFGLRIDSNLTVVNGLRILEPPILEMGGDNNSIKLGGPFDGPKPKSRASWNLDEVSDEAGYRFYNTKTKYPVLFVLSISPDFPIPDKRNQKGKWTSNTDNFKKYLTAALKRFGLETAMHLETSLTLRSLQVGNSPASRRSNVKGKLNTAFDDLWKQSRKAYGEDEEANGEDGKAPYPDVVVVLLPNSKAGKPELYSDIKWWSDCIAGIRTVCVSNDGVWTIIKYQGGNRMPLANLILKINFKLGNLSHRIGPSSQMGMEHRTMVMGADVTHPGRCEDENCPSMAGVVATCDNNFMHYLSSARLQDSNMEFIAGLQDMVVERLKAYKERSEAKAFPDHILFYRDGVSESQYGMVYEDELPLIRAAFEKLAGAPEDWKPKITLLVVGKRHHAKFFRSDATSDLNLPAGSVIDKEVIHPRHTEFYLQSHDSPRGTAKTAHYVVIVNESGYTPNQLQDITNQLCFTGSRATKGLSVCTPARYADILCDRLRCYMYPILSERMNISTPNALPMVSMDDNHLNEYRKNETIWVGPDVAVTPEKPLQERNLLRNPWRKSIEPYMFYL